MNHSLAEVAARHTLVLDGATGMELERRGVPCPAPLWSAAALLSHPQIVEQIHRDYVAAGADILVANTFRTNPRALRRGGLFERGGELNNLAVALARRPAADATDRRVWVAASVAPVDECYSPQLVPDDSTLRNEHAEMIEWLKPARPDAIWIETMNTPREARIAAEAAQAAGFPFIVSFVLAEGGRLLSGDTLESAVAAVEPFGPQALGLNCIPPRGISENLPRLRRLTRRPVCVYAHINNKVPTPGWTYAEHIEPREYAAAARHWVEDGANIVGGCCGTTPDHMRAVREQIG